MPMTRLYEFACDVCGHSERSKTEARPDGWAGVKLPRTRKLARKGRGGRTHTREAAQMLACRYCVNNLEKWVEKQRNTGNVAEAPEPLTHRQRQGAG